VHLLAIVVLLITLAPQLRVNWGSQASRDQISIAVQGVDPVAFQCQQSGLELGYRYEIRLCKDSRYWYDRCSDRRVLVRSLQWDPIVQTYQITTDTLGDAEGPAVQTVESKAEAMKLLSSTGKLSLKELFPSARDLEHPRRYVQVRLFTQCKGVSSKTVEQLSYFLSLGMVRTNGFSSGWISFYLDESRNN
jgi:hypothetical protein